MVAAVEKEMEARQMGISLTPEERFELFGEGYSEDYEREAEERWGDTEAWAQSQRRTAAYTKEDWVAIKAEADDVERRFAEAMRAGVPADSEPAMDVAEEHRQHISRWFYDCPPAMHAGLGRMYVEDERFTAHLRAGRARPRAVREHRRAGQRRPLGSLTGVAVRHPASGTSQTRISSSPCSMPSQPSSAAAQRRQAAAIVLQLRAASPARRPTACSANADVGRPAGPRARPTTAARPGWRSTRSASSR